MNKKVSFDVYSVHQFKGLKYPDYFYVANEKKVGLDVYHQTQTDVNTTPKRFIFNCKEKDYLFKFIVGL